MDLYRQRGVALITALLVVALAATAATAMVTRQQLDIRRTANMIHSDQTRHYALGAEAWGINQLLKDRGENKTDSLSDDWATILPPMEVEGGYISGNIEELQGRFNLNNLIAREARGELARKRFERLLKQLGLEAALLQAVTDWIDEDINPRYPDGAEDDYYLGLQPAYRTANREIGSISELRLIRGFDTDNIRALRPYITALPQPSKININTAPDEILLTLADDLERSDIDSLIETRDENAFATTAQFLQDKAFAGREIDGNGLGVTTDYFMIHSQSEIGRSRLLHHTLVQRPTNGSVAILMRSRGEY
ncbi:hypothetical protein BOW53_12765 [Solemya pervernicosa gill symbiont]|uniref:Type II secretion system protein K n=2 Tax=Gammaproteobacteria incertae sedis TaxID=118884 RepID=A0A1T2L239_9GAMM|nr:type II secretion system minor pseudopilin GspK [Candidatus Reidiella endopervernicosa]OOZ39178.1 hypothetical protein BOW53_12765 [Solemya pervernicosa gill symbiont]QKQ28004.1 type II secretion system minor pseudopilin GspK [Candidatus Reidiella endopervernicosa]